MPKPRILFVEDDPAGREIGIFNLEQAGYVVDAINSAEEAAERFASNQHDMVITDVKLPGKSGLELLEQLKGIAPDVPVLLVTAFGSIDTAVHAMKAGALDFMAKPFSREQLLLRVERGLAGAALAAEVRGLRARAAGVEREIICASDAMRDVLRFVDRVAASDATILITGETGTGKELIARRLHARGGRAHKPFVVVNCAAIPSELIESELFGHEKGTFTGAHKARVGRFRQADTGTLFLDEIGELPARVQGRLLRVLQEGSVDVLGSDKSVSVDVRIVAATNRDLVEMVDQSTFRRDLLYRLNVVEVELPALRERPEEIAVLVEYFVAKKAPGRLLQVPDEVFKRLKQQSWPGNVRELENACERLVALCQGEALSVADLPRARRGSSMLPASQSFEDWPPLPAEGLSLIDLEKRIIVRVLALKSGNVSQAAQYLQVPRHILAYRMVKYGIERTAARKEP